jgi:SAM-dependent methyltransferase
MTNWDERYRHGEGRDHPPHPLVLRAAECVPAGKALDVACGTGRHAMALVERGWQVTAVDASSVALELLQAQAAAQALPITTIRADLAAHEFAIAPSAFDLIVVTNYLQRDLFAALRQGVRVGGVIVAVIALIDNDPQVKPMNPVFLLQPGELRGYFSGWELLHDCERKEEQRRAMAELIARRLG